MSFPDPLEYVNEYADQVSASSGSALVGHSIALCGCWLYYYTLIHVLYYGGGTFVRFLYKFFKPEAKHLKLSEELTKEQIYLSELAFPLYSAVPALSDLCLRLGISKIKPTVEDCGGWGISIRNMVLYMFLVEGMIYYVHYWLLHKWKWGKDNLKHDIHHAYKHESEMSTWSGYAFEAVDGASQGLPFVFCTLLVPIPKMFHIVSGASVGMWTMYIHTGKPVSLPWPLMGSDYHLIHHVFNWYNFGLYTMFWDWLFGTLKHPSAKVDKFITETINKPKSLEELHQMFRNDDALSRRKHK
jgi:lathosterol oxidase